MWNKFWSQPGAAIGLELGFLAAIIIGFAGRFGWIG